MLKVAFERLLRGESRKEFADVRRSGVDVERDASHLSQQLITSTAEKELPILAIPIHRLLEFLQTLAALQRKQKHTKND